MMIIMTVIAKLRYLRIAPRKVRLVADLIRGKSVEEAQTILNFTTKKAAKPLLKLLKSAIANARHNFELEENNLYIAKITVDEGPKWKRWMPRARGMVSEIQKKTAHVTIVLEEIKKTKKKKHLVEKEKEVEEEKPELPLEREPEKVSERSTEKFMGKPKPKAPAETPKPKIVKGIKKIFRRKAI
jgi:large subunit ribosomal protein L22